MVPVKIECECGQNYAFDVEPLDGKMPSTVTCPSCGADGTAAADEFIAQQIAPEPAVTANPVQVRLTKAQVQPATRSVADDPSHTRLVNEAKTKLMGGDSPEQVMAFLTIKGFDPAEARELVEGVHQERTAIVRSNGVKKMIGGLALVSVPFIAYAVFQAAGRYSIRGAIWAYVVGIAGAYMFVSGLIMVLAPKSEKGTVVKE